MNDNDVWLYSVIDHENISNEQLQNILDKWSNDPTPNELFICGDKMVIKFKSNLVRSAYFAARSSSMNLGL